MNFIVENLNKEQFLEVATYYKWHSFVDHDLSKYKYKIYFLNDKPDGYDKQHNTNRGYKTISFEEWKESLSKPKENNMKYVVECNSQEEIKAVLKYVNNPYSLKAGSLSSSYPYSISSSGEHSSISFYSTMTKTYGPILSFKDWALMFGIELKPNKTIQLTKDYKAVVDYSEQIVEVGCQKIPFSKVEELAKLIKE